MNVLPPTPENILAAVNILQAGGVVAHATETCYGLACDMQNPEAVAKLFALKKRPADMPVSALFASIEQAKEYLEWNTIAEDLADKHLPGPLTIILKESDSHKLHVTPTTDNKQPTTIGLRISSHPTAQTLVEQFGSPLSTTSANVHGQPNPYAVADLALEPDLTLDDGMLDENDASTVVDVSDGTMYILRQGDILVDNG